MSEDGLNIGSIVTIGALVIGGYFVVKYVLPALSSVGGAVSSIVAPIAATPAAVVSAVTTPIVPATDAYPRGPTPLEIGIPVLGVPAAVEFAKTPVGGKGTPTPSTAAFLFPPLGIVEAITTLPKLVNRTINPLSKPVTPVQLVKGGPIVKVPVTQSLHGLINPKTGFKYSGR